MKLHNDNPVSQPVRFKLHGEIPASGSPWIVGSIAALGNQDPDQALPLRQNPDTGAWEVLTVLSREVDTFEYAFLIKDHTCGAVLHQESHGNRIAELGILPPDPEGIRELHNAWEGSIARLVIYHPSGEDRVLAVIGNHPQLGRWSELRIMALGPKRRLLNGSLGHCWELLLPVSNADIELDYRYVMVDRRAGTAIWEREPGRRAVLPPTSKLVNGMLEIFDANFVSGMEFEAVPPAMFIGPYPQTFEDVDIMKARGVTAVLNVQTDGDLKLRRIDWDRFLAYYQQLGIECHRIPIRDFDEEDLVQRLPEAVSLLQRLLAEGRQVYVHCTAGMGRSPAVVVAYLSRHHDKRPEDALAHVKQHRQIVCPNMNAVQRFIQQGGCEERG